MPNNEDLSDTQLVMKRRILWSQCEGGPIRLHMHMLIAGLVGPQVITNDDCDGLLPCIRSPSLLVLLGGGWFKRSEYYRYLSVIGSGHPRIRVKLIDNPPTIAAQYRPHFMRRYLLRISD